jgi:hypothetical protein
LDLSIDSKGIQRLLSMSKSFYYKTPSILRFIYWPAEKIYWLVSVLKLDFWLIVGKEVLSNKDLTIFYAGKNEDKHLLIKLAFDSDYNEKYLGKIWLWKIASTTKKMTHKSAISITEAPLSLCKIFRNKKSICMPGWIYGELDISGDLSSFLRKRSYKSDKRRIKKNKFKYEIINDLSILHDWYYKMHIPFIKKVHGPAAIIIDFDEVKRKFGRCDLFFITKNNEKIAGGLIVVSKHNVNYWFLGIKDGNFNYVKDGAIGALYYLSILHYKKIGIKNIEMGPSRSFLKDGVLKYKKNRTMRITNTSKTFFLINPLLNTDSVKGFFINNPMIVENKKRLIGIIFVENHQLFNDEFYDKIVRDYYIKGLSRLTIYVYGKLNEKIHETIPSQYSDILTIKSMDN